MIIRDLTYNYVNFLVSEYRQGSITRSACANAVVAKLSFVVQSEPLGSGAVRKNYSVSQVPLFAYFNLMRTALLESKFGGKLFNNLSAKSVRSCQYSLPNRIWGGIYFDAWALNLSINSGPSIPSGKPGKFSTSVVIINCPPGIDCGDTDPAATIGLRPARPAYIAAVRPAGPRGTVC